MTRQKSTPKDRSCILVMGMHRSGTSALGGVLGLLGNDLPSHAMEGNEYNQKGYFESTPISTLNSELLEALGSSWYDWHRLDVTADFPGRADFETRARVLLKEEFGATSQFVFKDPRNCRVGAFWLPLLRAQGCRIVALHTLRCPWEVAASLNRRDQIVPEQGLLLWLRHVLDAEQLTRDLPRFHTSYDILMKDWRGIAEKSGHALKLGWTRGPDAAAQEINSFLTGDLRHFKMTGQEDHETWNWVHEAYGILRDWSMTGETAHGRVRLDAIRAQLDQSETALQLLVDVATGREARQRVLEEEAIERMASLSRAESGWRKATKQLADLQIRTDGVRRADMDMLEARLQQTEEALQRRVQEAEVQYRDLLAARQEALEIERKVKQNRDVLHQRESMELKARYAQIRARLEEADAALASMRSTQENERKLQDERAAQLATLERELQKAKSDYMLARDEVATLRASIFWRITGPLRRVARLIRRQ